MKMKSPLFRGPLVNSSTENPIHILTREKLRHQTSGTNSTEKVILPNILHSYIKNLNLDFTSPYGSTGNNELLSILRSRFKQSIFPSSGLKCLDTTGDFLIKNVLHKRYESVQQNISNALSSSINSRTAVFFCILFSITVLMEIAPGPLLNKPSLLFSDNLPNVLQYTRDVYVNHVCIIHKSVSPCECEEPLNRIIRDMFPQTTFDPLELQKPSPSKVKTITYMLGTILLVITLMDKTGYTQLVQM